MTVCNGLTSLVKTSMGTSLGKLRSSAPIACCTGCLFTRCLFTGCLFTSCLFTSCLFVEPVACSPVTSGTGCLFSSYLFISCLFRFLHQLPIQVFKRFMCCSDSSLSIAAYLASRCFPASGRIFRGRHGCFLASFLERLYKFKIRFMVSSGQQLTEVWAEHDTRVLHHAFRCRPSNSQHRSFPGELQSER